MHAICVCAPPCVTSIFLTVDATMNARERLDVELAAASAGRRARSSRSRLRSMLFFTIFVEPIAGASLGAFFD